jgi:serine/threonine protein kinase
MALIKGKYALDLCIGRGGMAEVFAGRTVGTAGFSQRVAIKRIYPVHSLDPQFRAMFITEAQLGALLRHNNIVRVLDFDEDEAGCLFLVMDYVDGTDLDGLLHTGLLPLPVVLFITGEILRGLAYVHELPPVEGGPRGLVHRDISPQNVLMSWDGAVQISDFGIAKARTATQAGASMMIKGKPAYMSPEQARGLSLDGRSDVFAVGIMLWEMLCGEALFHDPEDLRATLAAVMFGDAPPPSSRARGPVPGDVERVTMQMLRRDREERHDAAAALAALMACAAYPRSGREALAALLPERLPERAPRRGAPRTAPAKPSGEQPASPRAAASAPYATAIAVLHDRPRAMPPRDRGSAIGRARRRYLRKALLGAAVTGALVGGMMHMVLSSSSSAARRAPSVRPAPSQPDASEPGKPADVRPADPAPGRGAGSSAAALVEATDNAPERTSPPRREHRGPTARDARARAPTPVRPAGTGGMQVIELRPEPAQPGPTGGARRDSREIDLGPERP